MLSIGAHALVLAGLVWISSTQRPKEAEPAEVTFFSPNGTGAPGKPALQQGNPEAAPTATTAPAKPRTKTTPLQSANAKPTHESSGAEDPYGSPTGDPHGSPVGTPDGTAGAGSPTATVTATATEAPVPKPQNVVIPFGPGMERPQKLSGPEPAYTREAREANVEGKLLAQCVITADGALSGCHILKSLPFMDQAVLSALAKQRWSPAKVDGKPVSVLFTIPFTFKLKN